MNYIGSLSSLVSGRYYRINMITDFATSDEFELYISNSNLVIDGTKVARIKKYPDTANAEYYNENDQLIGNNARIPSNTYFELGNFTLSFQTLYMSVMEEGIPEIVDSTTNLAITTITPVNHYGDDYEITITPNSSYSLVLADGFIRMGDIIWVAEYLTLNDDGTISFRIPKVTSDVFLQVHAIYNVTLTLNETLSHVHQTSSVSFLTRGVGATIKYEGDTYYGIEKANVSVVLSSGKFITENCELTFSNGELTIDIPFDQVSDDIDIVINGTLLPELTTDIDGLIIQSSQVEYEEPFKASISLITGYTSRIKEIGIFINGIYSEPKITEVTSTTFDIESVDNVTGDVQFTLKYYEDVNLRFRTLTGVDIYNVNISNKVTSIRASLSSNVRTLIINNVTYTYSATNPADKKFVGYGLSVGSSKNVIPLDSDIVCNYEGYVYFYELWRDVVPVENTFTPTFYKNHSEDNRVDKTAYLTDVKELEGTLRESVNILNPVITLEYNEIFNYNYVYIPQFNRYYFIIGIICIRKNIYQITCKCDVLMSFKDVIYAQTGLISRNEHDYNLDMVDNARLSQIDREIEYISIKNKYFDKTNSSNTDTKYVLTIISEGGR